MGDSGAGREVAAASRRANIFTTHRTLYLLLMIMAVGSIALAVNFYFSKPTFNPYGLKKEHIGTVFAALGAAQIAVLNVHRNLKWVRRVTALSAGLMLFWGVSTTESFFDGRSSLQLPIVYVMMAAIQFVLLGEPSVNPVSHPADSGGDLE